jgi:hypothetical protein
MAVRGCQIWAASRIERNCPSHFCNCLTSVQAGVRPGNVVKEKDIFHVLARMNSMDALSQFVKSFLVLLINLSEVEEGNFTTMVYGVLLNSGKCMLKMTETLWKNSLIITKDV